MPVANIDITADTILSNKILDTIWCKWWQATQGALISTVPKSYKNVSRRNRISLDFENWLFVEGNGAVVRQHYSNRYLEFPNKSFATMFILKWAS